MADDKEDSGQTCSTDSGNFEVTNSCSNAFNNDGSFLERFKQLQKEKQQPQKQSSSMLSSPTSSTPSVKLPPLLGPGKKLLTKRKGFLPQKTKPVTMSDDSPPVTKKSKGLFSNQIVI